MADILFTFTQSNSFKLAIDNKGYVMDIYKSIINEGNHLIYQWLLLLGDNPVSYEIINIELNSKECIETVFLEVCSKTNGPKKMIVDSHQGWEKYHYINSEAYNIEYNNSNIRVYDKDEAIEELSGAKVQITQIGNGNQATMGNNSSINK